MAAFQSAASAPGTTFEVTQAEDAIDVSIGDGVCATAAGTCSLRAAVQEANAQSGTVTINVGAGTFALSLPADPLNDEAGGDLDVRGSLRLVGAGPGNTIIQSAVPDRILHVHAGAVAEVRGLAMRNGVSAGSPGGAVRVDAQGALSLTDCGVFDSIATRDAANILTSGGGVFNAGTLDIDRSVISGNRSSGGFSGTGGGLENVGVSSIRHSRISGNFVGGAFGGSGGGISSSGSLHLTGSIVAFNEASSGGGLQLSGVATIEASTIADNLARSSGGGLGIAGTSTRVALVNSTVSGNRASGDGGGLDHLSGTLVARGTTVTANVADANDNGLGSGGGVFVTTGTLRLGHAVVAGNSVRGTGDTGMDCMGPLESEGFLLLGEAAGCLYEAADGDLIGVDPLLLPLGDYGGPTPTHAPAAGSPVVDAGAEGACIGRGEMILLQDQRGFDRPIDGDGDAVSKCDLGAVEDAPNLVHKSGFESSEAPVPVRADL